MVNYVKVRLYNKTNNSFAGNGLIVRRPNAQSPGAIVWDFVFKQGVFPFGGARGNTVHYSSNNEAPYELSLETSDGLLGVARIGYGVETDSFETMLISERLRTDSIFSNYKVILGDEVFRGNGTFNVNFEDLFIVEARQVAASSGILIKNGYTQNNLYGGERTLQGYHAYHRTMFNTPIEPDKPWKIGVELELYAKTQNDFNKIIGARTNWFQCERDGSLGERSYPIEMKTIPLKACDAKSVDFWSEPMAKLLDMAVSKEQHSTGLHVHISKEIFGSTEAERKKNVKKLITFYTYFIEKNPDAHRKNVAICGREHGYSDTEGAVTEIGNFASLLGIDNVCKNEQAYAILSESIYSRCSQQRGDINIKHWNDYGTIEFRKGKGIIGDTRLAAICTWWEQMCIYCKETHQNDLNFDNFFQKVCRENPCVAYFFQQSREG